MHKKSELEIWGGIECTINRVGDLFRDQCDLTGFYEHPSYLDAITDLGMKYLRFPVLWEKHEPVLNDTINWEWTENCLDKIQSQRIIPIVGLLHHGSGPRFTNLLRDDFPERFADYAAQVAKKFPCLEYYTPINEPLTTARFSGLYGLWYPHKKNDVSFIKILLNELKATAMAMRKIREVNASAKLIQTEDLGKTYSTDILSYQADFENHRRWLTYDILCGRFDKTHPLWDYVMRLGINVSKLDYFLDNPCPPDLIGANYYVTSERFLDEDVAHYPISTVGGNGIHRYADIEAVRTHVGEPHGMAVLLKDIWQRYQIPLAITEAHLNCTREEQLKWLHQLHSIAVKSKNDGVDVRAITFWALLGAVGWNNLLTSDGGEYETGAFDITANYTRPTAIASLIKRFVRKEGYKNLITTPGWWQLGSRFYKKERKLPEIPRSMSVQPIIIIGTGTLGQAFSKICMQRNLPHFLLGRTEADICVEEKISFMISRYHPWAIINAAGYVKVDAAESNKEQCYKENFFGVKSLAKICKLHDIKLMTFSSDLVFDGKKKAPYIENDFTNALNVYGLSKQKAEQFLFENYSSALIIRTSAFFGPWDHFNFAHNLIADLEQNKKSIAPDDLFISPTYVPHLVNASLDLLIDDASGIWHLANKGCLSWFEFAKKIVERTDLDKSLLISAADIKPIAERPVFSALASTKYNLMPSLDEALDSYFKNFSSTNFSNSKKLTNERI